MPSIGRMDGQLDPFRGGTVGLTNGRYKSDQFETNNQQMMDIPRSIAWIYYVRRYLVLALYGCCLFWSVSVLVEEFCISPQSTTLRSGEASTLRSQPNPSNESNQYKCQH